MKTITTDDIKNKLDEVLRDYLAADAQIVAGLQNRGFFGSLKYYELERDKADLLKKHNKLTDALVTIELYM